MHAKRQFQQLELKTVDVVHETRRGLGLHSTERVFRPHELCTLPGATRNLNFTSVHQHTALLF